MRILFETGSVLELPCKTLVGVNLDGLNLHRAIFEGMDLQKASFKNSNLRGAFMANTNLSDADFSGASLITTYLMNAVLRRANLQSTKAFFCNFNGADLSQANLHDADVHDADFSGSNLRGTILTCHHIDSAQFKNAIYSSTTVWPTDFDPVEAGCIRDGF